MDGTNFLGFNETEWMKLLFLISDTQGWMDEMAERIIYMVPVENKKKLFRKCYHISVPALAHILERHYFKIPRHPEASKFMIPVHEILHYIREAGNIVPTPIPGCLDFERMIDTDSPIGFNINGEMINLITVITDSGGCIKTAFPGKRSSIDKANPIQIL